MRAEISKLHDRLQTTMIYVTHDQVEAMTMGDRICVMNEGEIMQVDEPLNLYNHPANLFVASFIGSPSMNLFKGKVVFKEEKSFFEEINETENGFSIPLEGDLSEKASGLDGKAVVFGIRPEDTYILKADDDSSKASITAKVELSEPMGSETLVYLDTGENGFVVKEKGHLEVSNEASRSIWERFICSTGQQARLSEEAALFIIQRLNLRIILTTDDTDMFSLRCRRWLGTQISNEVLSGFALRI